MAFTSLSHHIDVEWMREAYRQTRKDGAVGVDGQSAREYEQGLEANLLDLLSRAKSGTYRAPPVRRVHIPKGDGVSTRPLGIPTFEDKVLQRAVVMLLEPMYEQDFLGCSYGFRPGRSAHQTLESFWRQMMAMGGGWVVEVDIRKYFDTIDHSHLRNVLHKRVRDGVVLRLIGKWLNAGVLEQGNISYPLAGTPQGGVISPLLANIFLHEVVDTWFERDVRPRMHGHAFIVRYADDLLMGFATEEDARRVLAVLPLRFGKYGLTLHPDKTRLVKFRPPRKNKHPEEGPGSFEFLGFTHYWALSRKGRWVVKRKTAKGRFQRSLRSIAQWCRIAMHRPVPEQHKILSAKLRGHYGYYGITGNAETLSRFRHAVARIWQRSLSRRSQKGLTWARFKELERRLRLPPAICVHSVLRRAASL
jgi:group II intron reverse transcriptase/maturase